MLNAKAEFSSLALEILKKLDMLYVAPALPLDLKIINRSDSSEGKKVDNVEALEEIARRLLRTDDT